jgi:hypothetical protein
LPASERIYDTHAVLGALRGWRPRAGTRAYFYGLSGRRLYKIELMAAGREKRKTKLGRYRASRIEGTALRLTDDLSPDTATRARSFSLWISDDADRLPILVEAVTEYGPVRVELVDYERPATRVADR